MNQEALDQKMGQIWARCWTDPVFKAQLLADPCGVLTAQGLDLPEGLQIKVLEDCPELVHWVIPAPPEALTDAELGCIAVGAGSLRDFLAAGRLPIAWSIARTAAPSLIGHLFLPRHDGGPLEPWRR
jgi:hypothetical protein